MNDIVRHTIPETISSKWIRERYQAWEGYTRNAHEARINAILEFWYLGYGLDNIKTNYGESTISTLAGEHGVSQATYYSARDFYRKIPSLRQIFQLLENSARPSVRGLLQAVSESQTEEEAKEHVQTDRVESKLEYIRELLNQARDIAERTGHKEEYSYEFETIEEELDEIPKLCEDARLRLAGVDRIHNEGYLTWIHTLPCMICDQSPSEAHHWVSRGAGGHDIDAVPLCRKHHQEIEDIGRDSFIEKYNRSTIAERRRNLLRVWIVARRNR